MSLIKSKYEHGSGSKFGGFSLFLINFNLVCVWLIKGGMRVLANVMSSSGLINGQKLITPTKSNLIKAMNPEL